MSGQQHQQQQKQPDREERKDGPEPFAYDENTFFVVVDEGDEDGRLRNEVMRRCKGVNPGKVVNSLPLMQVSERHKVCLVFRPHVYGERDMRKWPIKIAGPVKASEYWAELDGLNRKKFSNACGAIAVPATLRFKDEPGQGWTMRLKYA
jgi:hypothetical protein